MALVDLPFSRTPSTKANLLAFDVPRDLVTNRPLAAERLTDVAFLLMSLIITEIGHTITSKPRMFEAKSLDI